MAILRDEAAGAAFAALIEASPRRRISAGSYLEAALAIDGSRNPLLSRRFDDLISDADIAIEPVTEAQARIARAAYRDFGKRGGHFARLNFGNCFAYALARELRERLLFKGDDFRHTDLKAAAG